jgi:sugar lactone lactonase YvrE
VISGGRTLLARRELDLNQIAETGDALAADPERHTRVPDDAADGTSLEAQSGSADGFHCDQQGNLWSNAADGVHCIRARCWTRSWCRGRLPT